MSTATKTVHFTEPGTGRSVSFPAGAELPDYAVEYLAANNPVILEGYEPVQTEPVQTEEELAAANLAALAALTPEQLEELAKHTHEEILAAAAADSAPTGKKAAANKK